MTLPHPLANHQRASWPACWAVALVAGALLVLLVSPAQSQQPQQSATLRGILRDAQGEAISGATVQLRSSDGAEILTAHTDSQGKFSLPGLRAGVYVLKAAMNGYVDSAIPNIFLGPRDMKSIDLVLERVRASAPASTTPAFYDPPQFTVSGVTDTTSLGGHGSDTVVHARDSLARDTASLGKSSESAPNGAPAAADSERARQIAQELLAHPEKAELHHLLGDVQERLGNSLEAVREYQRAAEINPSEPYLFDWGAELLLHHAPEPATEVFSKGNLLFPKSSRMLIGLGASWFARGSDDVAVQKICEASDLDPSNAVPYLFLGKIDLKMDAAKPDAAQSTRVQSLPPDPTVARLRRFLDLHPESADANFYYAASLWRRRKNSGDAASLPQVESLLNTAIRLNPRFAAAHLQLGILHSEQHDFSRAIADYQQAIQSDPQIAETQIKEAHYRLANAYRQVGDTARAKAEIEIYDRMLKESAQRDERERHEIRQFVYTLRDQPKTQP